MRKEDKRIAIKEKDLNKFVFNLVECKLIFTNLDIIFSNFSQSGKKHTAGFLVKEALVKIIY